MDTTRLFSALEAVSGKAIGFKQLLVILEAAGLKPVKTTIRAIGGVQCTAIYASGTHRLECVFAAGAGVGGGNAEPGLDSYAVFELSCIGKPDAGRVSGAFDPAKDRWHGQVDAGEGDAPEWLQPFMAIVGSSGQGAGSTERTHNLERFAQAVAQLLDPGQAAARTRPPTHEAGACATAST